MSQGSTTTPISKPSSEPSPGSSTTLVDLEPTETLIVIPEESEALRPFHYKASEEDLTDLRRRIMATRWPDRETVDDDSQGVQLAAMQKLADYWANEYDWRKIEERLNSFPNFVTTIDGLDIHFIHVRSKHENALPIIITHGWPGSIIEQLKIIEPLTNPTAFGGSAQDAFDVVIPSMPGYGFSGRPTETGWGPPRIAQAWLTLMKRLGYDRFLAHGGDWGALMTEILGVMAPPQLLAIHTNMPSTVPPEIYKALRDGSGPPADLSAEELRAYERLETFFVHGLAYANQMGHRPQTLYGIADSPVGLAAWFMDHDILSYRMIVRAIDGEPEGMSRDDLLDNITIAWLTNTAISGARLYWEAMPRASSGFGIERNNVHFFEPFGVNVPTAVSQFPDELYPVPRSWAERTYSKLIHYGQKPEGGHFAAFEQPQLLVDELRTAFKSVRI
ncbi:epoxide hydrolase family protein [Sphingosinicella rhizophila]|uniref:Alpha/beta fold hydrolase n=1 Tax=Sphingosinicella rhizophila TaxID=3050082 RepID=A0ABU3QA19_9SPHN|nr:alpha/beta fold hydrolase [Sphingosinicella sp. GR2756]MDT9600255.1 alpha/beta fold hydrolase [Sphingosinicella sp. GR2756]